MRKRKHTYGFCSVCQKNIPHRRWIGNPIALMFDLLTLKITRWIRLGPWYCVHCDNKVVMLPLRRSDAIEYRSAALQNENTPTIFRQQTIPKPVAQSTASKPTPAAGKQTISAGTPASAKKQTSGPVVAELEPAESVGNFIKTESSLVKSTRMQRYSAKYRDAVVRRILTGSASIKQIRDEKDLSETEITDWIVDLFERQQQRLDALERFKDSISASLQSENSSFEDFNAESQTVPGHVRPR